MTVEPGRFAGGDRKFFSVNKAGGINTRDPRQSIKDEQFSWLENLQPIADGNYRSVYSNGTALYTTATGRTIVYDYPFNISLTNYIATFLDDGTAVAVNSDTAAVTTITSTVGSFYNSAALPQCAQSGQKYLIIVSTALHGYSIWDGTNLYTDGTLAPTITITNAGLGYSAAPSVVFSGGFGTGATANAQVSKGKVSVINITNPGSGYQIGDTPTITLFGGNTTTGSGAAITAVLSAISSGSGGVLTPTFGSSFFGGNTNYHPLLSIAISNGGSGYSSFTTATWVVPGGAQWYNNVAPTINLTIAGGVITAVSFTPNPGNSFGGPPPTALYVANGQPNPTISVMDNGGGFHVTSVTVTSGGSGYSPSTTVTASGGGSPITQATFQPVISAGVISSVTVESAGLYGTNTPPTLTVTDTAVTATATVSLMPFGNAGTAVEIYQSRVWIANGAVITFSAPNSVTDFSVADGAGAFSSTDSFLRNNFIALKQSSGFLYLFGDSSINSINNVQTGGSPVVTTFTNQNINDNIGTPWPNCVVELRGDLIFANTIGIFSLSGGEVTKVSDDLDGIFAAAKSTLVGDTPVQVPTAALHTMNEVQVYLLVIPVQGPLDGSPRTALVMSDGKKWWVGSQDIIFTQVSTQEINSVIQAWGNSTTTLRKLFLTKSGTLIKTWQSKLWSGEGLYLTKQGMRLYTMAIDNSTGGYTFTGTFDYMLENAVVATVAFTVTQSNLTGSGSINANVRGNYLGMTEHTTKDDFTLISQELLYQEQSPIGG